MVTTTSSTSFTTTGSIGTYATKQAALEAIGFLRGVSAAVGEHLPDETAKEFADAVRTVASYIRIINIVTPVSDYDKQVVTPGRPLWPYIPTEPPWRITCNGVGSGPTDAKVEGGVADA